MQAITEPASFMEVFEAALLRQWITCVEIHDAARRFSSPSMVGDMEDLLRRHVALREELARYLTEMRAVWSVDNDINEAYA